MYAKTVRPRATKFGMITYMGSNVFLGRQPRPRRKSDGAEGLPKFWDGARLAPTNTLLADICYQTRFRLSKLKPFVRT